MSTTALQSIIDANLSHATERVAIRLLALASNGNTFLHWEEYLQLCNRHNVNAARKHLTELKHAELCDYATNGYVYIKWPNLQEDTDTDTTRDLTRQNQPSHAPPTARTRATDGAQTDQEPSTMRTSTRHPRRADAPPTARTRATDGASSHARDLDREIDSRSSSNTNSISTIYTDEQLKTLCQYGISHAPPHNEQLTTTQIGILIANWIEEFEDGDDITTGALLYRLQHGWGLRPTNNTSSTPLTAEQQEWNHKSTYLPDDWQDRSIYQYLLPEYNRLFPISH